MAFTKLKNQLITHLSPSLFLFICLPLLPKWDGTTDANLAVSSGEVRVVPTPGGGLRAARLSFHSLCPGAALSFPSKMLEHTRISEFSGTDPEELQGLKEEAPAAFCISGPTQSWGTLCC